MTFKSPFLIFQEFISPLQCEQIIDGLDMFEPDTDTEGNPVKMIRFHDLSEQLIFDRLEPLVKQIEEYYDVQYEGTERIIFEWLPENTYDDPHCENSNFLRNKWVRVRNRDLSAVLFLCDYNEKVPFDTDYEVYGGKLEFPQHGFGLNPQRGTLVIYPSEPHFINNTTYLLAGDLYQARIHIATKQPFLYDPKKFPGDYREWLKEFA